MISPNGPGCAETGLRIATPAGMRDLGRELAALLRPGDLVILAGPLGAGKTTLVQGLGEGLGVRGPVTSPTFVIARVHPPLAGSGPPLVHADAYRLGSAAELDDLDLDADAAGAVTVVEWGEGLAEGLAEDRLEISIQPDAGGGTRTVRLTGHGARWHGVLPGKQPASSTAHGCYPEPASEHGPVGPVRAARERYPGPASEYGPLGPYERPVPGIRRGPRESLDNASIRRHGARHIRREPHPESE
jgi:tRNA threonylcarbamoyladenosine biosynthesis protein TsaE